MKIKEIITESPIRPEQEPEFRKEFEKSILSDKETWPDAYKILKKFDPKAKEIGSGAFGIVYGKPTSSTVLKTVEFDPETLKYLKWVIKNQQNPHVPKIYALFTPTKGKFKGEAFYVLMEKLNEFNYKTFNWQEHHLPFLSFVSREDAWLPPEILSKVSKKLNKSPKELTSILNNMVTSEWKKDPVTQTLVDIKHMYDDRLDIGFDYSDDYMHNIMLRPGTNEIVITDPVAS